VRAEHRIAQEWIAAARLIMGARPVFEGLGHAGIQVGYGASKLVAGIQRWALDGFGAVGRERTRHSNKTPAA
jgi:hypothetical protein